MTGPKPRSLDMRIRRLHACDQAHICAHFLSLDAESRRARFCAAISEDWVLRYARQSLCEGDITCGAFIDGRLRGVVELRDIRQVDPCCAEAAFSVDPQWQNIGIGDALFQRMLAVAGHRGIGTIQMTFLKENSRMRHLALRYDATLAQDQDDVAATLHPDPPVLMTLAKGLTGGAKDHPWQRF
ncbi:GNAT family N-acetyltransferase [Pararhodobacter oceanensis]|uniref:GNAT family N-acetyltransferase n=1 Tax=Pararhodobacter oceanensis TaxID=2172121 RepID=UPI003A903E06